METENGLNNFKTNIDDNDSDNKRLDTEGSVSVDVNPQVPTVRTMRKTVNHIFFWILLYNVASIVLAAVIALFFNEIDVFFLSAVSAVLCTGLVYLCTFKKWPFRPFARGTKKMNARDFFTLYGVFCITQLFTISVSIFTDALGIEGTNIDMGDMTLWLFIYAVILGPCVEELIYRGFAIGNGLALGKTAAIIMSAFAFGLMHGNLSQFVIGLLGGLVLGFVFAEYSIWWSLLIHFINNGTASIAMLVPESMCDIANIVIVVVDAAFAVYGIIQLVKRRGEIKDWFGKEDNRVPEKAVRSILTSPWFIIFTVIYVAMIILLMTFPAMTKSLQTF